MAATIDETEVRARFVAAGFDGIVALIDYLVQRRDEGSEIWWIGSGTIFGELSRKPRKPEGVMGLASWSLGSKRGSKLPIEDIANFTDAMLCEVMEDGRHILDALCRDFSCSDGGKLQVMLSKGEITARIPKSN